MNHEPPVVQAGFRKGRGTRDQIANICWIIKKAREFQKNLYFCFIDYANCLWLTLTVWITTNCGNFWKRLEYQTTLPASWETCQEATVGTGCGTMDWFQIGKGIRQGCILSLCRVHHEKHLAGRSTSWNQDCREKKLITSDMQMTPPLWQKVKRS